MVFHLCLFVKVQSLLNSSYLLFVIGGAIALGHPLGCWSISNLYLFE